MTTQPPIASPRGGNRLTAVVQRDHPGAPIVLVSVEDGGGGGEEGDDDEFGQRQRPRAAAADGNANANANNAAVLRRAGASACAALSLGVLGSTVFPIPFAVSRTGLLSAAITMALVAWANDQTSAWLISAAAQTGHSSYEALALHAGGKKLKRLTQLSLIALLWGTMVAGLCLIADTGRMALQHCLFAGGDGGGADGPAPAPPLAEGGGRLVMLAVSALVLFPLCLQRRMRELEAAGAAGGVLVLALVGLLFWRAGRSGWAGLRDVPIWSLAVGDLSKLPEAFAIYFTAFYMQPMLLPLVRDMPGVEAGGFEEGAGEGGAAAAAVANGNGGRSTSSSTTRALPPPSCPRAATSTTVTAAQGLSALRAAVRVTLYGVACGVYLGVGVAGAGAFGAGTHGNVLTNDVLDEGWGGDDGGEAEGGAVAGASGAATAATAAAMALGFSSSRINHGGGSGKGPSPPPSPPPHPKRAAAAALYALVLLYLALGMTTTQFALRSSLDIALFGAAGDDVGADAPATPPPRSPRRRRRRRRGSGADSEDGDGGEEEEEEGEDAEEQRGGSDDDDDDDDDRAPSSSSRATRTPTSPSPPRPLRPGFTWPRHVLLTAASIASAAFVACLVPRAAEKVYAVVGATGVCAVSYVIPALLKVQLYRERKGLWVVAHSREQEGAEGAGAGGRDHEQHPHQSRHVVARRAPRPAARPSSALALPLLLDGGGGERSGGGGRESSNGGVAPAPAAAAAAAQGGYIFGAAAAAAATAGAAASAEDDELGLASALMPPPPPPPPQPRVAVVRRPSSAAAATGPKHHHHHHHHPHRQHRWRLLPSFEAAAPGPERRALVAEAACEVLLPIAVASFGVLSSAAALAVAVQSAFFSSSGNDDAAAARGGLEATTTTTASSGGGGAAALLGRFVEAHVL